MYQFTVILEEEGRRLDEVFFAHGITLSRSKAAKHIKDGKVLVNGKLEKPHFILSEGDVVSYEEPERETTDIEGEDIPLEIVYEDDDVIVINKPAGLVVHPGNGHHGGTLVNALVYRESNLADTGEAFRPGIVHRIDKDTSGLLAIAKTEIAFKGLAEQLSDHSMHREYKALVTGIISEDDGKIDAPIARDRKRPTRNCVDLSGKEAVTYFHVEQRYKRSNATLISCRLLTGRTHQIRVHMEYIKHPVVGDPLYGNNNKALYDKGQLLHAYRLSFVHPVTKKQLTFEAPLPDYFEKILESLS